jgi:hypothetical protein
VPTWLEAGLWRLPGCGALVLGALVACFERVPQTVIAWVMAFGSGVLISAVAFDLMAETAETGLELDLDLRAQGDPGPAGAVGEGPAQRVLGAPAGLGQDERRLGQPADPQQRRQRAPSGCDLRRARAG